MVSGSEAVVTASIAEFYSDPYTVDGYRSLYIELPELRILHSLRDQLRDMEMLDIGVGAGRSSVFFAPFVKRYVGVDIAEGMVKACRERFALLGTPAEFRVADAADLRDFADNSFDFVLFSFNGIDCLNATQREPCLREIRRVLRSGGRFVFSSHNQRVVESYYHPHSKKTAAERKKERERIARIKANNDELATLLTQEQISFWDGEYADNPNLRHIYVRPEFQVRELERLGFAEIEVISQQTGRTLVGEDVRTTTEFWVYYNCVARK